MSDHAEQLRALIALCETAAQSVLDAVFRLGPRPTGGGADAVAWDVAEKRLRGQMDMLTMLIPKLAAQAVLDGLRGADMDLAELEAASQRAQQRIAAIANVSKTLTAVARVLDVGLAITAFAAAPSVATGAALAKAISALDQET